MNLPNKLTIFRIILVPVFVICCYSHNLYFNGCAAVIFVVASLTDTLDGYIARKYNLVTDFGKFLDPLADKILVTAAIVMLVDFGRMPAWICITILAREFVVTGLRIVAIQSGRVIAASKWGKLKTIIQMVGLTIMLLRLPQCIVAGINTDTVINWAMLIVTVWSGCDYLIKNVDLIRQTK